MENVARKLPRVAGSGQFGWLTGEEVKHGWILAYFNNYIVSKMWLEPIKKMRKLVKYFCVRS